jgi:hypothetical protein
MSTAVARIPAEEAKPLQLVPKPAVAAVADEHPLLPVFVAGFIALIGAVAFVGSIVVWLSIRYSGVLAP